MYTLYLTILQDRIAKKYLYKYLHIHISIYITYQYFGNSINRLTRYLTLFSISWLKGPTPSDIKYKIHYTLKSLFCEVIPSNLNFLYDNEWMVGGILLKYYGYIFRSTLTPFQSTTTNFHVMVVPCIIVMNMCMSNVIIFVMFHKH